MSGLSSSFARRGAAIGAPAKTVTRSTDQHIPSPRGGWRHCVVADGTGLVVHDPYPGPSSCAGALLGRLGCTEVWVLVPPYDPFPSAVADRTEVHHAAE